MFNRHEDTAEFILSIMELMKYDALALGASDFLFGPEFLKRSRSTVSFPYIASNLVYKGEGLPPACEYVIKKAGGMNIAILGVLDPEEFTKFIDEEQAKILQARAPEEVLKKLVPEVREKADLVVLLSQLNKSKQLALMDEVKGIDVSISSGTIDIITPCSPKGTLFLYTGCKGMSMGLLEVKLDDKRVPVISASKHLPMGGSVSGDKEIASLVEKHIKEKKLKKNREKKALMDGLQLSPREFMERYQKEQNEKGKGDVK